MQTFLLYIHTYTTQSSVDIPDGLERSCGVAMVRNVQYVTVD